MKNIILFLTLSCIFAACADSGQITHTTNDAGLPQLLLYVEYVCWTSMFSVMLPLVFYFWKFSVCPLQNHAIGLTIILSALTDIISLYTGSSILFNISDLLQFVLFTWFFYVLLYQKKYKVFASVTIGIYVAVLIFSALKYGLYVNYIDLWMIGSAIIFIHTFFYVFSIPRMIVERYLDIHLLSNMIFSGSIFIYFFVALAVFFVFDPVSKVHDLNAFKAFWAIHNVFNIVKNIGFALAFYYVGKRNVYMTFEQLEALARKIEKGRKRQILIDHHLIP